MKISNKSLPLRVLVFGPGAQDILGSFSAHSNSTIPETQYFSDTAKLYNITFMDGGLEQEDQSRLAGGCRIA